jgi:hypothetical protein
MMLDINLILHPVRLQLFVHGFVSRLEPSQLVIILSDSQHQFSYLLKASALRQIDELPPPMASL